MKADSILARLRRFLLGVSGSLFVGAIIELWLSEHFQSAVQFIPFALCGLGVLMVALTLWRPGRATLLAMRGCMLVIVAGGLFGVYEHISSNLAFEVEIHPKAAISEVIMAALGGAAPLLAPGILALAALLAFAATYYHPALSQRV